MSIQPNELTILLERLHFADTPIEIAEDYATVDAVCEATGEDAARIWQILDEIRRQDIESRIEERLRDAEAPLYSVERPDTSPKTVENSLSRWARQKAAKSILDQIEERDARERKVTRRE